MKWFDRWFYRKAKWAWENKDEMEQDARVNKIRGSMAGMQIAVSEDSSWEDGLRINVKKVIGGFIVSFRNYDRRTDRHLDRHYIINDEQDFNEELGKMITLESMKQSG